MVAAGLILAVTLSVEMTYAVAYLESAGQLDAITHMSRLPATLMLHVIAIGLAGVVLGTLAAVQRGTTISKIAMACNIAALVAAVPISLAAPHDTPFANLATLAALVAAAGGCISMWMLPRMDLRDLDAEFSRALRPIHIAGLLALALIWGTAELTRISHHLPWFEADGERFLNAGTSIYWATFGVAMLLGGLRRDAKGYRIAGAALLGVVLIKSVILDLPKLDSLHRVVVLLSVGLLLLGGSVAYGAALKRLRRRDEFASPEALIQMEPNGGQQSLRDAR
jgi:hypothetical protein